EHLPDAPSEIRGPLAGGLEVMHLRDAIAHCAGQLREGLPRDDATPLDLGGRAALAVQRPEGMRAGHRAVSSRGTVSTGATLKARHRASSSSTEGTAPLSRRAMRSGLTRGCVRCAKASRLQPWKMRT